MTEPRRTKGSRSDDDQRRMEEAEERWRQAEYKPELVERLRWDRRYSIVRVRGAVYAFSDYDSFVAALNAAWEAGVVPDHGPGSVLGIDLPDVAPSLSGVDVDLFSGAWLDALER